MRKASLRALRTATGEVHGLENAEPVVSTVGGYEAKGATRKGVLPLVPVVVLLVALMLAVALVGFAVQPAEAQMAGGTVVAWGANEYGQGSGPEGLSGVKAIAAGSFHSLALKQDGTVVAWGNNVDGLGNVPEGLSNVKAVSAGQYHNLALKDNGTVVAWGDNYWGQGSVPEGLSGVKAIAAGGSHSLALKDNGTVVAWGSNGYGQSTVPSSGGIIAIAAGGYHSLALDAIAPGPVGSFDAVANDGKVSLSWKNPSDADFEAVRVLRSSSGYATSPDEAGQTQIYQGAQESFEDTNLTNGTTYYYTAFAKDKVGNWSASMTQSAKPLDTTAPGSVASFSAAAGDGKVSLSWTNPSDADFDAVRVLRSTSGNATTPEPNAQQTQIYEGTGQSYEDTNLANGTTYYYTAFAKDKVGNWSTSATQTATPQELTAPTIDSVTPAARPKPPKRTNATATFSEDMDGESLKAAGTFTLLKKGKSTPVGASVSYDPSTRTLTLDPTKGLREGGTYTARITTAAEDVAGNGLAQTKVWSFTVRK